MRCRLCEGPADVARIEARVYHKCRRCGYIGLDESHFPSEEAERERYLFHDNSMENRGYVGYLREFLSIGIEPWLPPPARILDFGSGPTPALSTMLGEAGYEVFSFDPFFAPDRSWEKEKWAGIVLHEVAEHLRDPEAVFSMLAGQLAPGGILAIRTRFAPESLDELKNWWYRHDSTHVGFFAEESFGFLAATLGLSISLMRKPDIAVLRSRT